MRKITDVLGNKVTPNQLGTGMNRTLELLIFSLQRIGSTRSFSVGDVGGDGDGDDDNDGGNGDDDVVMVMVVVEMVVMMIMVVMAIMMSLKI